MKISRRWMSYLKRLRITNKDKIKKEDEFTISTELIQELKKHVVVQKFTEELNLAVRRKFDKSKKFEVICGLEEKDEAKGRRCLEFTVNGCPKYLKQKIINVVNSFTCTIKSHKFNLHKKYDFPCWEYFYYLHKETNLCTIFNKKSTQEKSLSKTSKKKKSKEKELKHSHKDRKNAKMQTTVFNTKGIEFDSEEENANSEDERKHKSRVKTERKNLISLIDFDKERVSIPDTDTFISISRKDKESGHLYITRFLNDSSSNYQDEGNERSSLKDFIKSIVQLIKKARIVTISEEESEERVEELKQGLTKMLQERFQECLNVEESPDVYIIPSTDQASEYLVLSHMFCIKEPKLQQMFEFTQKYISLKKVIKVFIKEFEPVLEEKHIRRILLKSSKKICNKITKELIAEDEALSQSKKKNKNELKSRAVFNLCLNKDECIKTLIVAKESRGKELAFSYMYFEQEDYNDYKEMLSNKILKVANQILCKKINSLTQ